MIRVLKLGGSLLALPNVAARFERWLAEQRPAANLLLVGGGPAVDRLRERHRLGQLNDEQAHWAAVSAMRDNAQALLAGGALRGVWLERLAERPPHAEGIYLLDPVVFLREIDPGLPGGPLPSSWEVTSDSIAARVAEAEAARELVLLKSALPPTEASFDAWADAGFVDRCFPTFARELCVVCVDLSREPPAVQRRKYC